MSKIISSSNPIIRNIKVHFCVDSVPLLKQGFSFLQTNIVNEDREVINVKLTQHANFFVMRDIFVYTIFLNKGYINATKIPNYTSIDDCIKEFCKLLQLIEGDLTDVIIDNTTYAGNLNKKVDLRAIHYRARSQLISVKFNPIWFPAVFLKFSNGTVNLFQSGKYMIVGVKKNIYIYDIVESLQKIVNDECT